MPFASALAIPPELFEYILDWVVKIALRHGMFEKDKHPVSLCSLTCKYWASICRPMVFSYIHLRCLADVHTLLSFPPTTRAWIRDLFLDETEPCLPWRHVVHTHVLRGAFTPTMDVHHRLQGPDPAAPTGARPPLVLRSLHPSLPSRRPPEQREVLTTVAIRRYRLRSFADVLHLARKLPCVSQVEFADVAWAERASTALEVGRVPGVLAMRRRALCSTVTVRTCGEVWPFVWLCITTRPADTRDKSPRVGYMRVEEALYLGMLMRCITEPIQGDGAESRSRDAVHVIRRTSYSANIVGKLGCSGLTLVGTDHKYDFRISIGCEEPNPWTPECKVLVRGGVVKEITLWLNTDPTWGYMPFEFDWEQFDAVAAQFAALTMVVICVDGREVDIEGFLTKMTKCMPALSGARKLVFKHFSPKEKGFVLWEADAAASLPSQIISKNSVL